MHLYREAAGPYHGLGEGACQIEKEGHEPPAAVDGSVHHVPRVHSVGSHPMRREATVQLTGEEDVAELGSVVGQHGPVLLLGWREHSQIHLSTSVHQICEPTATRRDKTDNLYNDRTISSQMY